tara:strand:- start:1464 stop:1691 length:228 start_codon:yes stop_codon:yes gene_type:complete
MINERENKMQTLKEQNIDTKKINYISFERPTDCMVILFQDGSSMLKTFDRLSNKQIKMLEKFEKTDLDIEFKEIY